MKRHLANLAGKIVDVTEAKPVCGTDYCDDCGDCLACCSADLCRVSKDGTHRWVTYIESPNSSDKPRQSLEK
jgi:hypothetical protein